MSLYNSGMTVIGLDVSRKVVKDDATMNMDEFSSDEDEVPVKYEVSVREGKTT